MSEALPLAALTSASSSSSCADATAANGTVGASWLMLSCSSNPMLCHAFHRGAVLETGGKRGQYAHFERPSLDARGDEA